VTHDLPSFARNDMSPGLPGGDSMITLTASGGPQAASIALHGSYRVTHLDRPRFAPVPLRRQVALVVAEAATLDTVVARPGAEAPVFADEEPLNSTVSGWFHVQLVACCALDSDFEGALLVTAVLGPLRSETIEIAVQCTGGAPWR